MKTPPLSPRHPPRPPPPTPGSLTKFYQWESVRQSIWRQKEPERCGEEEGTREKRW